MKCVEKVVQKDTELNSNILIAIINVSSSHTKVITDNELNLQISA